MVRDVRRVISNPVGPRAARDVVRRYARVYDLVTVVQQIADERAGKYAGVVLNPAAGWSLYGGPYSWQSYGILSPLISNTPRMSGLISQDKISGQAISFWPPGRDLNANYDRKVGFWWNYDIGSGQRSAHNRSYTRPFVWQQAHLYNVVAVLPGWAMPLDPNFVRKLPGSVVDPVGDPIEAPGQLVVQAPRVGDVQWTATATGIRASQRRHLREPPAAREHQGKLWTQSMRFAQALVKVMDGISEGSEVITAFYDALPEDLRKQIEKARFPNARWIKDKRTGKWRKVGMDRQGDQYGQYGIEGADWKAQALWEHWDKVDFETAFENVFKNYVEDKVIGGIHRKLPRNYGNANPEGDREFAKRLEELVDYVLENM